ncbi:MAG: anaerobic C4-dicarboxylate transporter [Prevotella histicola]|jgi:transporter, anaerobic C4-dicarboxylate uptake (dcu) family|uniref:C4-dicarboxylate ABC transporter n=1 Tax=Prevotella histicola JCM 15637 = DNF00424 TaxID=1236504 RepID=A0AAW3FGH4_9BACT|nr:anaerobic C4-dicarboxylate transporter [Prevotella histicola]KGF28989.1 C4-dicarboxylate ABC transporter [Prevotella histicola JCM 15637 = DNF00424]MBF1391005.1 anaerobic C4-dicarboxylate transporter [Prevotella histicola]
MITGLVIIQLLIVLALIFIGARVGGIGLGIYGMIGVFILVYGFGLAPGSAPIDVMMIIVAVITAASALQASGGLEYLVGVAAKFLQKHPDHITYFGPITCWLFCVVAGTAHTSYSLMPIIAEIAQTNKIRPERPLSLSVIAASLGITCSPVSAATAALISQDLLGAKGIELGTVLMICIPTAFISILVAAFVENRVGKELEDDPEYKRRVAAGLINPEAACEEVQKAENEDDPSAKHAVWAFLFGVALVILFGFLPQLRPEGVSMSQTIEMIMMSDAALILLVGKGKVGDAVNGNIFKAGMNAVVAIFGIAWMGNTFYVGNEKILDAALSSMISSTPILFAVALFLLSIMLFSQAATVTTLYPVGIALGINPLLLIAMFPACNGYFFLPNYPTEVAAIDFDRTGTTRVGKYVINHSFQIPGFITTIVSILLGVLMVQFFR